MRALLIGFVTTALACVSPGLLYRADLSLWRAPEAPTHPQALRIEPRSSVARYGGLAELRVRGPAAASAECSAQGLERTRSRLRVPSPDAPGVVSVRCTSGAREAYAQITFTDARTHPASDPYEGGVVALKLRRTPRNTWDPAGTRRLGRSDLDGLLHGLGAYAFPAFPFSRSETRDPAGLARWVLVDLPAGVNFYQAAALLREHPAVYPESYLPLDAEFLRVASSESWPAPLQVSRVRERGMAKVPRAQRARFAPQALPTSVSWELLALGAPEAWQRAHGSGVGIAVVDSGVDVGHVAIKDSLRTKPWEKAGSDDDQNGLPGDRWGANFAHLTLAYGSGVPRLALGDTSVSDWHGRSGRGTAIAAVAASSGRSGTRFGVAPGAWILPVDVEENLRAPGSSDPRMRSDSRRRRDSLRSDTYARALGIAYAAAEGARVAACAWQEEEPTWILHDAFAYAEANCVVSVCAQESAEGAEVGFPAGWRASWLKETGGGTGPVADLWRGERREDFFKHSLHGVVLADSSAHTESTADVRVPTRSGGAGGGVTSAVARPANDAREGVDRRVASFAGPEIAAGLAAGAAALVTSQRPDLEPAEIADALRGESTLHLPDAVAAVGDLPQGRCDRPSSPSSVASGEEPFWKRMKIKVKTDQEPDTGAPPANADPEP